MQLSLATEYGSRGLVYLALAPTDSKVPLKEICKAQEVPKSYLIKIFKNFTSAGLLRSAKGMNGGFVLAQPADEITIHQVLDLLEGSRFLIKDPNRCLLSPGRCRKDDRCLGFKMLTEAKEALNRIFEKYTLADCAVNRSEQGRFF
ncbi:MAG: RrF2 family transcriptional regulator [Candidatus Binatia bacterium]